MILRTARKGRTVGQDFWGCSNWPACKQAFPLASSALGRNPKAADARQLPPSTWIDFGCRPGWDTQYLSCGGRLRSTDSVGELDQAFHRALSHCALFTSTDADVATQGFRLVGLLARRIAGRGTRPPVDPQVEEAILEHLGHPFP